MKRYIMFLPSLLPPTVYHHHHHVCSLLTSWPWRLFSPPPPPPSPGCKAHCTAAHDAFFVFCSPANISREGEPPLSVAPPQIINLRCVGGGKEMRRAHPCSLSWWGGGFFCVCRRPDGGGAEGAQKKPFLSSAVPTPFFLSLPLPYRRRKEAAFLSAASPLFAAFWCRGEYSFFV